MPAALELLSNGRSSALAMLRSEQHQCVRFDGGNSLACSIATMASPPTKLSVSEIVGKSAKLFLETRDSRHAAHTGENQFTSKFEKLRTLGTGPQYRRLALLSGGYPFDPV
jgi:hypothetical protein